MNSKCIKCQKWLNKLNKRYKIINEQDDIVFLSSVIGRNVSVNDVLCNSCRLIMYKKRRHSYNIDKDDPDFTMNISKKQQEEELVELPVKRIVSTHKYCCVCGEIKNISVIPHTARIQCYTNKQLYIPQGNRCCQKHLIKNNFYEEALNSLKVFNISSQIPKSDLMTVLNSISCDSSLLDKIGSGTLSEKQLFMFTGLTWDNIHELVSMISSMRNSSNRTIIQALVVFLFKLRSGNSNNMIASILGIKYEQLVSDYVDSVLQAFEKDILQFFGLNFITRETIIAETSEIARQLFSLKENELCIICDGTYIRHQKSQNNVYQKKSYSGQKKVPLCKPFTICTTNGYIIDMVGPFNGTQNDASIMQHLMSDANGLPKLLKPNDVIVVDRGFRDVCKTLKQLNYKVLMPALKGNRSQLPTDEANQSRLVTKVRWVVEAVHGILKQKYNLLDQKLDNKMLSKLGSLCKIACFLNNRFGKRLISDDGIQDFIVHRLKEKAAETSNSFYEEISSQNLIRKKVTFSKISSNNILDFPKISEEELKIFFCGTYQLSQAICYLAELITSDGSINIEYFKDQHNIIRVQIKSRHISKKIYHIFIDYSPFLNGINGIKRYYCSCPNGSRTAGCCSHLAAVIYYLSCARFKSKIIRPSDMLTNIFDTDNPCVVIEEDSDED